MEERFTELRIPSLHLRTTVGKGRWAGREQGVGILKEVGSGAVEALEAVRTCFGQAGGLRAGEEDLACGGRSGNVAG